MLSSHHYKSFKVSMIHRLRFTTDVQLGKCMNRWWSEPFMSVVSVEMGKETTYNFYVTWMTDGNLFSEKMFKQWNLKYLLFPSRVLCLVFFFMKQKIRNRTNLRLFSNRLTSARFHNSSHSVILLLAMLRLLVALPLPFPTLWIHCLVTHALTYSGSFTVISEVVFGFSPDNSELTCN